MRSRMAAGRAEPWRSGSRRGEDRTRGGRAATAYSPPRLRCTSVGERTLCGGEVLVHAFVRMSVVMPRPMLGPQLRERGIALLRRQAREFLADLDDVGRSRARTALRERQLAPLAKDDRQQDQQRHDHDGDSRREQAAEQRFGQWQAHQYCSTGTPIT